MQHGSRNHSGKQHQIPSQLRLLLVTVLAVFIGSSWLVTMNLDSSSTKEMKNGDSRSGSSSPMSSYQDEHQKERTEESSSVSLSVLVESTGRPTGESEIISSCLLSESYMTSIGDTDTDDDDDKEGSQYCSLVQEDSTKSSAATLKGKEETEMSVRFEKGTVNKAMMRMDCRNSGNRYKLVKKAPDTTTVHVAPAGGGGGGWVVDDDFERTGDDGRMFIYPTSGSVLSFLLFPISVFFLSCNNTSKNSFAIKLVSSFFLLDVLIASSLFYKMKLYRESNPPYLSQILLVEKSKNSRLGECTGEVEKEKVERRTTGAPADFSSILKVTRPFVSR